jgi:transposase InsO family protein
VNAASQPWKRRVLLQGQDERCFRVKTTDSKHNHPIAPDRLDQDFRPSAADQVRVSDITYIPTDEGWLNLLPALQSGAMIVGEVNPGWI